MSPKTKSKTDLYNKLPISDIQLKRTLFEQMWSASMIIKGFQIAIMGGSCFCKRKKEFKILLTTIQKVYLFNWKNDQESILLVLISAVDY